MRSPASIRCSRVGNLRATFTHVQIKENSIGCNVKSGVRINDWTISLLVHCRVLMNHSREIVQLWIMTNIKPSTKRQFLVFNMKNIIKTMTIYGLYSGFPPGWLRCLLFKSRRAFTCKTILPKTCIFLLFSILFLLPTWTLWNYLMLSYKRIITGDNLALVEL